MYKYKVFSKTSLNYKYKIHLLVFSLDLPEDATF